MVVKDFLICAAGDSIRPQANKVHEYNTIGLTDVSRIVPTDYTLIMDRPECFRDGRREIIEQVSGKVWCFNDHPWEFKNAESVDTFDLRKLPDIHDFVNFFELAAMKIFPKLHSSLIPAIGLATHLSGIPESRIGLLGVDLDKEKHHMGKRLEELDMALDKLRAWLDTRKIKLVNCGGSLSKIQSLPPIKLEFLRKK